LPSVAREFTFPAAAGMMASGALMGVAIIFWQNGSEMLKKFFGHWSRSAPRCVAWTLVGFLAVR